MRKMSDEQFMGACSNLNMPGLSKKYKGWPGEQLRHLEFNMGTLFAVAGQTTFSDLTLAPREAAAILRDFMLPRVLANSNPDTVANILEKNTNARLLRAWKMFC